MQFLNVLSAEIKKMKRTRALWLAIIAPLFISALTLLHAYIALQPHMVISWGDFLQQTTTLWLLLMLTLYVAVEGGLASEIEHTTQSWKYLFALPVSRTQQYLAKLCVVAGLIGLSNLVFFFSSIIAAITLNIIRPNTLVQHPGLNIWYFASVVGISYVLSFFAISIQTWIGISYKSFVVPIGVGILATVGNVVAMHDVLFRNIFPWIFPYETLLNMNVQPHMIREAIPTGFNLQTLLAISVIGAIVTTILAIIDINRRDIL